MLMYCLCGTIFIVSVGKAVSQLHLTHKDRKTFLEKFRNRPTSAEGHSVTPSPG